jgi:hypothetical protein
MAAKGRRHVARARFGDCRAGQTVVGMTRPLNPNDPNVVMLELAGRRLGSDLCSRFAFVGGSIAGLLITDPANPPIRSTKDVDIVAEVLALSG